VRQLFCMSRLSVVHNACSVYLQSDFEHIVAHVTGSVTWHNFRGLANFTL